MLIDSHVLLWFAAGDRRLPRGMRKRIESEGATVSAASLWEIAIKAGLGKLEVPDDLPSGSSGSASRRWP